MTGLTGDLATRLPREAFYFLIHDFCDNIYSMDSGSQQLKPELVVLRKERFPRSINGSGLTWLLIVLVLILMAFAVSMFRQPVISDTSGSIGFSLEPTPSTQPRVYTVSYKNGVFSPTNLRIKAGDTVRFKNESIFSIRIIGDDLVGFDSIGDVPQGSFFAFTFAAKGIFSYYSGENHNESATIIVR